MASEAQTMFTAWQRWQAPSRDHVIRRLRQIGAPVDNDTDLCVEDTTTHNRGALTAEEDAKYQLILDMAAELGADVAIYVWSVKPCDIEHSGFVRRLARVTRGSRTDYLRLDVDPIAKLEGFAS